MAQNKIVCEQCSKNIYFKRTNSPIFVICCKKIVCMTCYSNYEHICQNKKSLLSQTTNPLLCTKCKMKIAAYSCTTCKQKYFCKECCLHLHSKVKFTVHQYEKLPVNENIPKQIKHSKIDKENPQVLKFRDNLYSPTIMRQNKLDSYFIDITNINMKNQIGSIFMSIDINRSSLTLKQIQIKQNWFKMENQVDENFRKVQQILLDKWNELKRQIQENKKIQLTPIYESIKIVDGCQIQVNNVQSFVNATNLTAKQSLFSMQTASYLAQKINEISFRLNQVSQGIKNKNFIDVFFQKKLLTSIFESLQKINCNTILKTNAISCLKLSKMASSTVLSNESKTKNKQKLCIKKCLNQMKKSTTSIYNQLQISQDFQQKKKKNQPENIAKKRKNSYGESQKNIITRIKSQKYLTSSNNSSTITMKSSFLQNLNELQKQKHKQKQKNKEVFLKKSYIKK